MTKRKRPAEGVRYDIILVGATGYVGALIADYLVQGGARVYALSPQRISLEELFMRVMEEEE